MAEYIEREALIAEYDRVHIGEAGGARKLMVEAPAVDVVEVVHSKWIKSNNERRCPICDFFYLTNGTTVYNLCPMCGAKMDGERRSENES
jgi:hypothetical protein